MKSFRGRKLNAAGQTLVEFVLLTALFLILIAKVAQNLPATFSKASPYLGGKIQQRLETGHGFSAGAWEKPLKPKGGIRD